VTARDRVEHRAVARRRVDDGRLGIEDRLHIRAHAAREGHFGEDQGRIWKRWMEERIAPAIPGQAPFEVSRVLNSMNGLVFDDLVEHRSGRAKVDSHEPETFAGQLVEPLAPRVNQGRKRFRRVGLGTWVHRHGWGGVEQQAYQQGRAF
jgi:hypothetical protein